MAGSGALFLLLAIVALVVAAGAVQASIAALLGLVRGVLAAVFVNLGRLLVLGLVLICLVVLLFYGLPPSGGPVG